MQNSLNVLNFTNQEDYIISLPNLSEDKWSDLANRAKINPGKQNPAELIKSGLFFLKSDHKDLRLAAKLIALGETRCILDINACNDPSIKTHIPHPNL